GPGSRHRKLSTSFFCADVLRPHQFVRSTANDLGIGKLAEAEEGGHALIHYFPSPLQPLHQARVPIDSLELVILDRQTRAYFRAPASGRWRAGRVLNPDGWGYFVAFPNKQLLPVASEPLFVRWDRPIDDPTGY